MNRPNSEEMFHAWSSLQDIRPFLPDELYRQVEQEMGFGGKSKAAEDNTGKETWND